VLGLLAGGTLILSLQLLISLRSSEFCRLTGLCPAELAPGSEGSPLRPALAAAEALQATGSMGDFEQALARLEGQLQRLRSEALTPEDQQQLGVLEAMAGQARQRLQAERLDEERLRRAEVVLLNAEQAAPAERPALISQAAAELEAITRGSFAAPQADALRLRLQRLEQEAAPADPAADGAGTAPRPDSGQPGSGQPTAPPDPQPLPAPERASPPGSEAQVAPERTQPGEPG
jgi:hypothetical protein